MQDKNLNFGQALDALRNGKMVRRTGWNGAGQFVFRRPAYTCDRGTFMRLVSVPDNVKVKITEGPRPAGPDLFKFMAYLSLYNAQGEIVNGWVPSQGDIFSWDWEAMEG